MTAIDIEDIGRGLRDLLSAIGIHGIWLDGIMAFIGVFVVANFALANGGLMSFVWRKEMALIQDRWGPNRVGPGGLLQFLADGLKMILKQAMVPKRADRLVFIVTPVVAAFPFVMAYLVIPFSHGGALADLNVGVLYLFAITSLAFPSVFMAGWSSNNKYAMMGGMRAIAQLLAFEVPLTMSALGIVVLTGSLSTQAVVGAQSDLLHWFLWPQIIGATVFFIAGMAENAAHPFDLPEAESELVAGYYTEYSGIMFGLFFLAELGTTWTLGAVFSAFFLGGWQAPLDVAWLTWVPGVIWFLAKAYLMFGIFTLARFSMPRFRIDQFLGFGWKILTPLAFINLLVAAGEALAFSGFWKV